MSRVTISTKAARALEAWREWFGARLDRIAVGGPAEDYSGYEMDLFDATAPEPKRKPRQPRPERRPILNSLGPSRSEKRERRASIREAVFKRSEVNGVPRCEGPGGQLHPKFAGQIRCGNAPTQLAHAFGRGKGRRPECVENCMALCDSCAYAETHNQPSAAFWWNFRADFFEAHGYIHEARAASQRAAFVETRSMLGAGLKEREP